jgi:polyhydroxybutyrate depolymerase
VALPPPSGQRRPLVIGLHGYDQRAVDFDSYTGLRPAGVVEGAVVAVPQGMGTPAGWNVPDSPALGPSDLDLVAALVDRLVAQACVDPRRVVLAGLSDGADMAVTAACALPGRIAAVLLVAASTGPSPSCRPLVVVQVHGTADPVDAYAGRAADTRRGFGSVKAAGAERALQLWSALGDCRARTERTSGDLRLLTSTDCTGTRLVRLIAVRGGGHTWPGAAPRPALGRTTASIDTTSLLRIVLGALRG